MTTKIVENYYIKTQFTENKFQFAEEELFLMATRINKKRKFLFVSTVLGKHLAVKAAVPQLTGRLLAMLLADDLQQMQIAVDGMKGVTEPNNALKKLHQIEAAVPTLFIGFAETATALGHATFSHFSNNAYYVHTTREQLISQVEILTFEEEHSHATSHRLYGDSQQPFERIVLIDDEISTGKTLYNIIGILKEAFPTVKNYAVLSILNWLSQENEARLKSLGPIEFHSIVKGQFECIGEPLLVEAAELPTEIVPIISHLPVKTVLPTIAGCSIDEGQQQNNADYLQQTGRFMMAAEDYNHEAIKQLATELKEHCTNGKTVVIGTGEFMYIPMQIAAELGDDVYFHATTRSPIHVEKAPYTITQKLCFDSPENSGVENYLYNLATYKYEQAFVFVERAKDIQALQSLKNALAMTNIPKIMIVVLSGV